MFGHARAEASTSSSGSRQGMSSSSGGAGAGGGAPYVNGNTNGMHMYGNNGYTQPYSQQSMAMPQSPPYGPQQSYQSMQTNRVPSGPVSPTYGPNGASPLKGANGLRFGGDSNRGSQGNAGAATDLHRARTRRPDTNEIRRVGRVHYEELFRFLRSHLAKGKSECCRCGGCMWRCVGAARGNRGQVRGCGSDVCELREGATRYVLCSACRSSAASRRCRAFSSFSLSRADSLKTCRVSLPVALFSELCLHMLYHLRREQHHYSACAAPQSGVILDHSSSGLLDAGSPFVRWCQPSPL